MGASLLRPVCEPGELLAKFLQLVAFLGASRLHVFQLLLDSRKALSGLPLISGCFTGGIPGGRLSLRRTRRFLPCIQEGIVGSLQVHLGLQEPGLDLPNAP